MSKGYILKYSDEVICATMDRELLVVYLYQKGMRRFNHYYDVERISKRDLYELYGKYILTEHDETKMIVTPEDIDAWGQRMERLEMVYGETLNDLEYLKTMLHKKKDLKKIDEAIEVLKKRKSEILGKEGKINAMADILAVPVETILEEREMFRNFVYAMNKED